MATKYSKNVTHSFFVKHSPKTASKFRLGLTTTALWACMLLAVNMLFPTHIYADTLTPTIDEIQLEAGQETDSEIIYVNQNKTDLTIKVETALYDTLNSKIIKTSSKDKLFVIPQIEMYTIKPNQSQIISYKITVPKDTPVGTYFNLISFTEQETTLTNANIAILKGLGTIVRIDVIGKEPPQTAETAMIKQSDLSIDVTNSGGLFRSTQFTVSYKNNSDFVITPHGYIFIVNNKLDKKPIRLKLHIDEKRIYPNQQLTETYSVQLWTFENFRELFQSKTIVARIQNNQSDTLESTSVIRTFDGYILLGLATVCVVALFLGVRQGFRT